MRKSDIAAQVAGRAPLTKAQAKSAVIAVFDVIRDALANGDTVSVTGFGRFSTRSRTGLDCLKSGPPGWAEVCPSYIRRFKTNLGNRQRNGMRTTTPPMTSPSLKSFRGLSLWSLWHVTQAGETAISAYTAVKYLTSPRVSSP